MRIAGIIPHSFVDGPGIRFVVFFQGCFHSCPGCHNPETHDFSGGQSIPVTEVMLRLWETAQKNTLDGVTLSGGEPLLQQHAITEIAEAAHKLNLPVMVYTGYTIEFIESHYPMLLRDIDILMDGRYVEDLKVDVNNPEEVAKYPYRGSKNQRMIDVKKWLNGERSTY